MLTSEDLREIVEMDDVALIHNIGCAERVLGNPSQFPNADMPRVLARWGEMVAEATGRALVAVTRPNLEG
jgi:hypothetical protein